MKFKKIILMLLLFTFLTISSVSAIDNNTTNDMISLEDNMENNVVECDNTHDNLQISEDNSTSNNPKVLESSAKNNSVLSTSAVGNGDTLLKSSFLHYNYHDDYEYGMIKTEFWVFNKNLKVDYKSNSYFEFILNAYHSYSSIDHAKVILKIWTGKKVKQYTLRTNTDGWAEFNTKNLKVGTHKVQLIYNGKMYETFGCKATAKIIVKKSITKKTTTKKKTTKKKKSNLKTVTIKINPMNSYFATKKLKTGDKLQTLSSGGGQYNRGVYAEVRSYDYPIHTKIKKVKFYFRHGYSNKIKVKTVTKIKNSKWSSQGKTSLVSDYYPFKAKVWYKKV